MIQKTSLELLNKLFNIEYSQFILGMKGNMGVLSKSAKAQECLKNIMIQVESRNNSIFTVTNNSGTGAILISTVEVPNDHIQHFILTISESVETFKLEEVHGFDNNMRKSTLISFDKSKV
jgi:hypothetical protein